MTKKASPKSDAIAPAPAECMTIDEVAGEARLSRRKIYKLISEKKLTARKIGRSTRVLRADYSAFLRALPPMVSDAAA